METFIAFGKGTLFRFCFVLMILGLGRILFLALARGANSAPMHLIAPQNGIWAEICAQINLMARLWRRHPIHSLVATVFHLGLLAVAFFLAAHVSEWKRGAGIAWWSLPQRTSDTVTLIVLFSIPILLILRWVSRRRRENGNGNVPWRTLVLGLPFVTGYFATHFATSAQAYQSAMLVHVFCGDLIILFLPFTRMARCVIEMATQVAFAFGNRTAVVFGVRPETDAP